MVDLRRQKGPEISPVPENIPEKESPVVEVRPTEKEKPTEPVVTPSVVVPPTEMVKIEKPPLIMDIEGVLEEGLSELYISMPPALQAEFKQKGEETTSKIAEILAKGKDMAKKIFEVIVEWLKLIPGVNKFFLEHEAKIKTDKVLQIKK